MFRDDRQRAAVCQALVDCIGKGVFWVDGEATELGIQLRQGAIPWSHGEQSMWHLAWCLWNSENVGPPIEELWEVLDGPHVRMVASLLVAMSEGSASIDTWLAKHRQL